MIRLCLMRCFHPERLLDEIRSFVSFFLGVQYTEAPPFDFSSVLSSASSKTPILFMNGPNVNCLNELHIFKKSAFSVNDSITIQYQPLGSVAPEKVAKLIIKSACRGEWLLLDNLQLALGDLYNLMRFTEAMVEADAQQRQELKAITISQL